MLCISHIAKYAVVIISHRNPDLQFSQGYVRAQTINSSVLTCSPRACLAAAVERLLCSLTWFPATEIEGLSVSSY